MYSDYFVIALGLYMLAMGLIGYSRTKSPTALYVNGGIGLVTLVLGLLMTTTAGSIATVTLVWLILNTLMLAYLTSKRIRQGRQARGGSVLIFGSMTLFAAAASALLAIEML